jgi:hypothetical protein
MLLSIFSSLYEGLLSANPENPEYRDSIFPTVGVITLVVSLVIALIFYGGLGRWKPVFHKRWHWVMTLILTAVVGFVLALLFVKDEIGLIDGYTWRFTFVNALYVGIYFIIFSLILKRFSIFAKHTPL